MDSLKRASNRYLKLIEELWSEVPEGYRSPPRWVAEKIGSDRDSVQKWKNGIRVNLGMPLLTAAMDRLKLRSTYFFGREEPRTYHDFVGPGPDAVVTRPVERSQEFRAAVLTAKARLSMTPDEERWAMEELDLGFDPTPDVLEVLVLTRRRNAPQDDRTAGKRAAAAAKGYRSRKG